MFRCAPPPPDVVEILPVRVYAEYISSSRFLGEETAFNSTRFLNTPQQFSLIFKTKEGNVSICPMSLEMWGAIHEEFMFYEMHRIHCPQAKGGPSLELQLRDRLHNSKMVDSLFQMG
jgi:hypothetical protein